MRRKYFYVVNVCGDEEWIYVNNEAMGEREEIEWERFRGKRGSRLSENGTGEWEGADWVRMVLRREGKYLGDNYLND